MKNIICLFLIFCSCLLRAHQLRIRIIDTATSISLPGSEIKINGIDTLPRKYVGDKQGKAIMLKEVSVAGTQATRDAQHSVHQVKILDAARIRAQGAVNLTDLLSSQMNVRLVNDNVNGANIMVQGLSGQNVKILLDGIPIIAGENNQLDLNQLGLSNAARVEFVENAMAVQYGSNATAGVINIVTKATDGNKPIEGNLSAFYETAGKYNVDGLLGIRFGDSSRLSVALGRNQFQGFSTDEKPRSKLWNPSLQYSGNLRYFKDWKKLQLKLAHNQFYENQINKGDPDPGFLYRTTNDVEFITNRFNSVLGLSGELFDKFKIDITNSYQHYSRDNHEYLVNLTDETRKELNHADTWFGSYAFRGNGNYRPQEGRLAYLAGYDINLNRSKGQHIDPQGSSMDDYGIYGGIGYQVVPSLYIQAALRWLHNSKFSADRISFLGTRLPLVPALNIKYDIVDLGSIRLAYTKSFRAPSLRELYWDFQDANHSINGNPDLKPELADNVTASLSFLWQHGNHRFGLSPMLYYNHILEKIELVDKDRTTMEPHRQYVNVAMVYQNITRFYTYGGNLGFTYSYKNIFSVRPAIGLLIRSGSNSLNTIYRTPEANATVTYNNAWSGVTGSLFYKYNGKLSRFGLNAEGQLQDRSQGDYHLLDFSLARTFATKWFVTLGVKNIAGVTEVEQTNTGNANGTDYSPKLPVAQGRQAFFRLTRQF
ncbi:TonB-dependent receptor [Sphingobacterium sp. N143]|uniref:TonB-dependent receptor plug domain-containing protein n=1 Tax=Sphingobacterium sp. N143 TaxID=2746727 RepID=UPI002576FCE6|nr:TonB-dependent receptor [Sphingobacterium sp. N143]MDM1296716.1 TonB-dependent receptor [Sphingobacterium sp. N143]